MVKGLSAQGSTSQGTVYIGYEDIHILLKCNTINDWNSSGVCVSFSNVNMFKNQIDSSETSHEGGLYKGGTLLNLQ